MSVQIYNQKNGALNEADRTELGRLLYKARYMVKAGKKKANDRPNSANVQYIEIWADGDWPEKGK